MHPGQTGPVHPAAQIHPTAIVDEGAVIEAGARVWHWVHVCVGARVGAGTILGQNVFVAPDVTIGAGCKLQNNVSVYTGVTLEDEVFVGPSAVFTNVTNPRAQVSRRDAYEATLVKRRATLGANCTIVCGVTIGEAAFIGAGAVVTQDVPPRVQMLGNPARPAGHRCDCGEGLGASATDEQSGLACTVCGARYAPRDDGGLDRVQASA